MGFGLVRRPFGACVRDVRPDLVDQFGTTLRGQHPGRGLEPRQIVADQHVRIVHDRHPGLPCVGTLSTESRKRTQSSANASSACRPCVVSR
jgi:hypothetical protein